MKTIHGLLEFLGTIIMYTTDNTIEINKTTLVDIQTCLQNTQEKNRFFGA